MVQQHDYDVLVVGGGVNGAGIARDAAGRGLRVLLCEQDDLASHTSSRSTKLIHGGLRYLEHREFGLVRKALKEREVLLKLAPHIIWPLRFVMPHMPNLRPAWMIRLGLFLYDHLSRRETLPGSRSVNLRAHVAGTPLVESLKRGFIYSDGWVDDARLVVLNALDAQSRGATILTRTRVSGAQRTSAGWQVELTPRDARTPPRTVTARALVNAAGPWTGTLLQGALGQPARHQVRLVKGSHIVTRRLFDHDYAYIFQNPDQRIVFAIPYEKEFTLIGTTDVEFTDDPAQVDISAAEIEYLCGAVNHYFVRQIAPSDVVWHFAGVRPLLEDEHANDPSAVTRDYRLDLDLTEPGAPLLSVFGGKITTFRVLAEEALDKLAPPLGISAPDWTAGAPLPGGDLPAGNFAAFEVALRGRYPWLPAPLAQRYARVYGSRALLMLGQLDSVAALGDELTPGLHEVEARMLIAEEWARTADDILWRRTKLGLHADAEAVSRLTQWLQRNSPITTATAAYLETTAP
ncbi:glycerol-3-phosphate dehydrogenase [Burkholderia sp. L27(2015)]|uniref:glycerol-3-phosphate dehydrogenase n=1 Tax=Burkholderia sp. L27(2015) TaxID=1641858 RepID=UPI00131D6D70|nr:glycerol-3-phosphate dehydrogenase [Burkholderia sp. L27(2015)]